MHNRVPQQPDARSHKDAEEQRQQQGKNQKIGSAFVVLHMLASKPGPNRDTPIYVITADTSDDARVRAFRRHAVFFLSKPVQLLALQKFVESTLQRKASRP